MISGIHIKPLAIAVVLSIGCSGAASAQSLFQNTKLGASAQIVQATLTFEEVVGSLEQAGYSIVEIETTMLGRKKIQAKNARHLREIIVTRRTGEILRDVILQEFGLWQEGEDDGSGGVLKLPSQTQSATAPAPSKSKNKSGKNGSDNGHGKKSGKDNKAGNDDKDEDEDEDDDNDEDDDDDKDDD